LAPPDPETRPHRRYNPLTGEWLLVSPQRTQRPWQGQVEAVAAERRASYDPGCYLCPGNRRAAGDANPAYAGTFVFDNDFSALVPGPAPATATAAPDDPLLVAEPVSGICRVICFSPRHDLTLAEMDTPAIGAVVDTWAAETEALGARYRWVQLFENKGAVMGCSNPHPHGQIWASSALPTEAAAEDRQQRRHFEVAGSPLLVDYLGRERALGLRVVAENAGFTAVVPFWATWPFETIVLPRRPVRRLPELDPGARADLAALLGTLLGGYDRLFGVSFPYSMGWHGAPFDAGRQDHWQLHAHVYPPLLRSATVKKFMVGYEMLAEPQRDLTPEQAAARLRAVINSDA
jgi:UDPglucose--hexose-1-phosphate uridylyltransferase